MSRPLKTEYGQIWAASYSTISQLVKNKMLYGKAWPYRLIVRYLKKSNGIPD